MLTVITIVWVVFLQEYLTIDSQGFNVFHYDGRMKEQIDPEEPVERLLYAKEAKRYVGWNAGDTYIKVCIIQKIKFESKHINISRNRTASVTHVNVQHFCDVRGLLTVMDVIEMTRVLCLCQVSDTHCLCPDCHFLSEIKFCEL